MKKLLSCLVLALLITPVNLQAEYHFEETFFIPLPKILTKWKMGYKKAREDGSRSIRYILESETIENWTELVNVQFKDRKLVKCSDALEAMKQESVFNNYVIYKIHKQSPNDLIFEKIFPTGMHEIVRMVMTEKGLHRIAYIKRDAPFFESDRNQWLERISSGIIQEAD